MPNKSAGDLFSGLQKSAGDLFSGLHGEHSVGMFDTT